MVNNLILSLCFCFVFYKQWLDLTKTIQSQFKKNYEITLFFNVKYYLNDPCSLKYENTRYLFYLQLRQDILQGRLEVDMSTSSRLFGYLLQGILIRLYNPFVYKGY